ncbi:MAG: 50S ribosomal protein L29 [Gammaproteobacteria bacterium]
MAKKSESFFKSLEGKSSKELEQMILENREEQFQNNMKHKTGQLEKSHVLRETKKKIAQIKTALAGLKG